jgi:hypothetical protein
MARILDEMRESHAALQGLVHRMPDQDLFRVGLLRGPYWDSLAEWLQVAWEHEREHAAQIRIWREQLNAAGADQSLEGDENKQSKKRGPCGSDQSLC